MGQRENIINELKLFKKELSRHVPIQKMMLFGSFAKGTPHQWSDVDLLLVSPAFRKKKFHQRLRGLNDYWTLSKPVDFLCYSPEEFDKLRKSISLVKTIVKEGVDI